VVSTAGTVSNRSRGGRPSSINLLTLVPERIGIETLIWSPRERNFVSGPIKSFAR
jgi:hypothetical protein